MVFERIFWLKIFIVSSDGYQVVFQINLLFDLIHSKWLPPPLNSWIEVDPFVVTLDTTCSIHGFSGTRNRLAQVPRSKKIFLTPWLLVFFSMVCPLKMHRMEASPVFAPLYTTCSIHGFSSTRNRLAQVSRSKKIFHDPLVGENM